MEDNIETSFRYSVLPVFQLFMFENLITDRQPDVYWTLVQYEKQFQFGGPILPG
jgi:hypothetical protein